MNNMRRFFSSPYPRWWLGGSVVVGAALLVFASGVLSSGCGSPSVSVNPDSSTGGTFVFVPDGGIRSDGLSERLEDGGLRPLRPPPACTRIGPEVAVTNNPNGLALVNLRWTGTHYVLVYNERNEASDARVVSFDKFGKVTAGSDRALEATSDGSGISYLTAVTGGLVATWEERGVSPSIRITKLKLDGSSDGAIVTAASFASKEGRPVAASSGPDLVLAWMDTIDGAPGIYVQLFDPATLQAKGTKFRLPGSTTHPSIVGTDTGFLISYSQITPAGYEVKQTEYDRTFTEIRSAVLRPLHPEVGILARSIPTSNGYLTTWEDERNDATEIFVSLNDLMLAPLGNALVQEENSGDGNWSHAAWSGDVGAIVFYQFRFGKPAIFLSYVDGKGQRYGGKADLKVSDTPVESSARFPDIAWNGEEFGVSWIDGRSGVFQAYFARVVCTK